MFDCKVTLTTYTRSVSQYKRQQKDTVSMENVIGSPSVVEDRMS
jgi:hypothetical protein